MKPSRLSTALILAARAATYHLILRQRRFLRACEDPEPIQRRVLFDILKRQAATAFGRDHGFASIRTIADFRRQVAVGPYERLEPYIARMMLGETSALLADDRLRMFALTSGSTAARKHIPITDRYLAAYSRGWNLWGIRAYRDHRPRRLVLRPIVQMVGDMEEYRTTAGTPCGNASGLTATIQRRLIRRLYIVPPESGKMKDSQARYRLALRMAIGTPVALFSAANPSTLLALARTLGEHAERLVKDLHDGTFARADLPDFVRTAIGPKLKANPKRARELSGILERNGTLKPSDVWPAETILLATWTGGSMGPYLKQLPAFYGDAPIRNLGLLASEGRFTIPFADDTSAGVLDIWSHYYEFIPEDEIDSVQPTVLEAHEVIEGKNYFLIPTTVAGLYRYDIADVVRVVGFQGRTPLIEFLGKGKRFSSLTGEKISEHQVGRAIQAAIDAEGITPGTVSLLPRWHDVTPNYVLAFEIPESDAAAWPRFAAVVERKLRELNTEYDAKRESGRLGPVGLAALKPGTWQTWDAARLAKSGGSPEQYKHPLLIGDLAVAKALLG